MSQNFNGFDLSIYGDSLREQLEGARQNIGSVVFCDRKECEIVNAEIIKNKVCYLLTDLETRVRFYAPADKLKDQ